MTEGESSKPGGASVGSAVYAAQSRFGSVQVVDLVRALSSSALEEHEEHVASTNVRRSAALRHAKLFRHP